MLGASRDCFYNFIFTMSQIEVSNNKSFLDLNIKTGGLIMMITQMNLGHAKHLTWVFSAKIVDRFQSLTIFTKKFSSQMFVRVLNFPLQNNKERDKKTTKANSCKKMLTKNKILMYPKTCSKFSVLRCLQDTFSHIVGIDLSLDSDSFYNCIPHLSRERCN